MNAILLSKNYKYADFALACGAKINANLVTIEDGKVTKIEGANATIADKNFNFSVYTNKMTGEKTYNINSMIETVNAPDIIREFISVIDAEML